MFSETLLGIDACHDVKHQCQALETEWGVSHNPELLWTNSLTEKREIKRIKSQMEKKKKKRKTTCLDWVGEAAAARHNPSGQESSAILFPRLPHPLQVEGTFNSEQGHLLTHKYSLPWFHV